jgi:hypothetical protein
VTPVFKKGSVSSVTNYRPISLTCVLCKVFETCVKKHLTEYLFSNGILDSFQHGFIAGSSTVTNLIESLNDWTINIKNGNITRVAFIDFSRAFDTVCHKKLLYKLACYGVRGQLLNIIESFLYNRSQRVILNGQISETVCVSSGVPQGSVLGPLLFLIYINDLSSIFPPSTISKCFADDAKLYTEINTDMDILNFQHSLNLLARWAKSWQLSISIAKCSSMDIYPNKKSPDLRPNLIDGNPLTKSTEVVELGVKLDNRLIFTPHIHEMIAKAKQRVFLIFRAFITRDTHCLLAAYKSYILPTIMYCSSVWSPCGHGDISAIESVQRLFTKKLPGLKNMSYPDRLIQLNLPSLELRRLRADLLLCYKILLGLISGPPEKFGLCMSNATTRGHPYKLFNEHVKVKTRKHFFASRIVRPWNALPLEVVQAGSPASFKRLLENCDLDKFIKIF